MMNVIFDPFLPPSEECSLPSKGSAECLTACASDSAKSPRKRDWSYPPPHEEATARKPAAWLRGKGGARKSFDLASPCDLKSEELGSSPERHALCRNP